MMEFKFKVGIAPTQETIEMCNQCAAKILIDRYGAENIKKLLEIVNSKESGK